MLGYAILHGGVVNKPASEALFQGKEGDTTYYMFPTELVPILMPLQMIGVPKPILSFFDEFFRVVIDDAYLRDVNPGVPTAASLLPIGNPIGLVLKLLAAIPVAIDNALEDLGIGRVLGTTPSGPFGVGGPPLACAAAGARHDELLGTGGADRGGRRRQRGIRCARCSVASQRCAGRAGGRS